MKNFDLIRPAIMNSSLEGADKMAMIDMLAEFPDDQLQSIAELLQQDPQWIEKLNDNRKKKLQAFSSGNSSLWKEILDEEVKYLSNMNYDLD